jgi:3-oxoacyl-[acyl-carrier-protein] synthase-1
VGGGGGAGGPPPPGPPTALCVSLADGYLEAALARQPELETGLDEDGGDMAERLAGSLLPRVCEINRMPVPPSYRVPLRADASGFVRAIEMARDLIAQGGVDRCIVGGVDACTDARYLTAAHHFGAVRAGDQAAGFQPGEGAAFLLVEPEAGARARGAEILGSILATATGTDPVERAGDDPPLGIGLADTIDRCLRALPDGGARIGWLIANLNGDAFRANDWAYALVRLRARYPHLAECPVNTPAESFGELGAASGPVAACVAVRGFARRYAPAAQALVWLASHGGGRGACVVGAPS